MTSSEGSQGERGGPGLRREPVLDRFCILIRPAVGSVSPSPPPAAAAGNAIRIDASAEWKHYSCREAEPAGSGWVGPVPGEPEPFLWKVLRVRFRNQPEHRSPGRTGLQMIRNNFISVNQEAKESFSQQSPDAPIINNQYRSESSVRLMKLFPLAARNISGLETSSAEHQDHQDESIPFRSNSPLPWFGQDGGFQVKAKINK